MTEERFAEIEAMNRDRETQFAQLVSALKAKYGVVLRTQLENGQRAPQEFFAEKARLAEEYEAACHETRLMNAL